jgi:hypothetical protein
MLHIEFQVGDPACSVPQTIRAASKSSLDAYDKIKQQKLP